jgi:hypothetical protein
VDFAARCVVGAIEATAALSVRASAHDTSNDNQPRRYLLARPRPLALDVDEGNLPTQSVVVVSQLSAIDKVQLGEWIGSLSQARVEQILAGLRFQQASFFRE